MQGMGEGGEACPFVFNFDEATFKVGDVVSYQVTGSLKGFPFVGTLTEVHEDYVLIAASFGASAADLAPNADLCLIFAEDENDRAALQEEFHAAGARAILPAGLDALGEIVEAA